jgi:hypothetical protein
MGTDGKKQSTGSLALDRFLAAADKFPESITHREIVEARLRKNVETYRVAAQGLVADLAAAGFEVFAACDLLRPGRYPAELVPILVRWMGLAEYDALKEDIVRTLAVPWARAAARALIAEFEVAALDTRSELGWAIGNSLEVLAHDAIGEDLIRLATDRRYGTARQMVVRGLRKLKKHPRVVDVLIELLADEDVYGHAMVTLGKLRAKAARPHIERLLQHEDRYFRADAKQALARIDKPSRAK